MRKHFVLMVAAMMGLALWAGSAAAQEGGKLKTIIDQMQKIVNQPIGRMQMSSKVTKEQALDPSTPDNVFKKAGVGYFWSSGPTSIWLRAKYVVPDRVLNIPVAGTKIALLVDCEEQGEIYVNGEWRQHFERSNGYTVLTEKAKPGDTYFIVLRVERRETYTGLLRNIGFDYSVLTDIRRKISGINDSIGGLGPLLSMSGQSTEKWQPVLDKAASDVNVDALRNGDVKAFYASIDRMIETLKPVSALVKKYSMYIVGYSHIDLAWLWPKSETEHIVVKGTNDQVLNLMKDFPDFVYVMNQMHAYRWIERDYPDQFKQILAKIKEGKWEPVGAEWTEPDGNVPAGESYVRQFLYGRKYSKQKLGVVSSVGWTPDSFGYNWNLPQILAKSDMRGFVTQKISWNDTTRFPYNLFWWYAPDGSRVLVYFPQGGYGESVHGDTMAQQLENMKSKHGVDSNLVIAGVGDHGGGIPRDYVERAYALRENPLYPKIEFPTVESVFNRMIAEDKTLHYPSWKDELYLEYHRGTYTTQSNTKNNNRRNEIRMMNAERFSSIASIGCGLKYDFDKIEEAWKILLFNQFHDILPGSSITPVYKDATADHLWIEKQAIEVTDDAFEAIANNADTSGVGIPLVLFNGLSWKRDDVVEVPMGLGNDNATVTDDKGAEVPTQVITKADGSLAALFVARNVPPMGFAVYHLREWIKPTTAKPRPLSVDSGGMENEFFKVTVDPTTGWVTSIFDKKNNREIVQSGKAAFQLQAYRERPDSDAWDPRFTPDGSGIIPPAGSLLEMPKADEISIVEKGPVRVTIMTKRKFSNDTEFTQYFSLVEGMPVIYGRLDADWHETNVFLKSAFNLNLDADYATFEIPYAAIQRPTKPKTPGEKAKWEMSGHRWVDYTDNDKSYGVTLLSFRKYGYDVKGNVLRMTMLRAPTGPDPVADRGFQSIPYALYPHKGDWPAAASPLRGAEYNDPILVYRTATHPGKLGKSYSAFSAGPQNVVLSDIKRAEDGNGFVLRLVETSGKDGAAVINLPAKPKKVTETNLVERQLGVIPTPAGKEFKVPIGHYEIKTIKVVF